MTDRKLGVGIILAAVVGGILLLTAGKRQPLEPSALLYELQDALNEAYIAVEAGYPEDLVMIPGYGLANAEAAVQIIPPMMIAEAISMGLISSSSDCYFVRATMYYSDGTTIVP